MWRWHTSGDVPVLIEDGRFILVPVGTGSSSRHTPSMVFHDCDVFVISRTWSITLIIVTNHKERGGFVYIPFSSTGPPSQEKWHTLTAVISGWSILKQKSTPIMWRLLFDFNGCVITPLLKISTCSCFLALRCNAMGLIDGSSLEYACCFKFGALVIVTWNGYDFMMTALFYVTAELLPSKWCLWLGRPLVPRRT